MYKKNILDQSKVKNQQWAAREQLLDSAMAEKFLSLLAQAVHITVHIAVHNTCAVAPKADEELRAQVCRPIIKQEETRSLFSTMSKWKNVSDLFPTSSLRFSGFLRDAIADIPHYPIRESRCACSDFLALVHLVTDMYIRGVNAGIKPHT